jgi:hypothetical protein
MNIKFDQASVSLGTEKFLKLHDCKGTQVQCLKGSLWITQDSDSRDYVLGPGDSLELEHGGDAIVFALMQSELLLREPVRAASPLDRFGNLLLDTLESMGQWIAAHFGPEAVNGRKLRAWYGAL